MPRLAVVAVDLELAEPVRALRQLRVDVALRHHLGSLSRLLGKLRGLGEVLEVEGLLLVGLRCRLLLTQFRLVLIELRPHRGGGDGATLIGADGDVLSGGVLLIDSARQTEDAGQVEDGVRLEPVLFSDALDGELPAAQDTLGVVGLDGLSQLPAGVKSAAGENDRDGASADLLGELVDDIADLCLTGPVLVVEVSVEDTHTGNIRRLRPLVRSAGLDRLGSDPRVLLAEQAHRIVDVEILDAHCGCPLDLIRGHGDEVTRLEAQHL